MISRNGKLDLDLYRRMYLVRRAEEAIRERYLDDEMKTPMHMSAGGEAIAAGICQALRSGDQVIGTYRSHALYLAKTLESDGFFAEMYGRVAGVSRGKGGSMHLNAPEHGLICTSAIVASNIPVSLGAAFANRQAGNGRVVAVFFVDGAIDEGAFSESLNSASGMGLPVLFVCEDNGYAVHSHRSKRHGYAFIDKVVQQFDIHCEASESTDAREIYDLTRRLLDAMTSDGKPGFLHLHYYRYLEHVGVFEDFNKGYRERAEMEQWLLRDPLVLGREALLHEHTEQRVLDLEAAIDAQVEKSIESARAAPFPEPAELMRDVLA